MAACTRSLYLPLPVVESRVIGATLVEVGRRPVLKDSWNNSGKSLSHLDRTVLPSSATASPDGTEPAASATLVSSLLSLSSSHSYRTLETFCLPTQAGRAFRAVWSTIED